MWGRRYRWRDQPVELEPMDDGSDTSNQTWFQGSFTNMQLRRSEMNELIMDYLVHEGFKEAAERFREEAGMAMGLRESPTPMDTGADEQNQQETNGGQQQHQHQSSETSETSRLSSEASTVQQAAVHNGAAATAASGITHAEQVAGAGSTNGAGSTQAPARAAGSGEDKQVDWIRLSRVESAEMLDRRIEVRRLIEQGDILKAQSLINLYYPEFLDLHRALYFKLQQQHLIELIRRQKISDVLAYVHDYLSVDELRDLTEMERTLALLAYEQPDKSPYASLLHSSHRLQLASEINDHILQETTGDVEPSKPRLVTMLKMLFWTQSQLEEKKFQFPKMTDLVNGTIVEARHT